MKVLSIKTLSNMGDMEIRRYVISLEKELKKRDWYKKNENGTLNEKEQEAFNRIMDLFRWVRINAD